jgi:hypothetical protein
MTVPVPYSLPTSSQWQLMDWTDPVLTSAAAAGGTMQVQFRDLDVNELWLIDRAVIQCDSTTDTKLRLYAATAAPANLLSGSDSEAVTGNFDEAEYPRGLLLRPSQCLLAVWTGASTGARGTIRLQAQVFRKVTG